MVPGVAGVEMDSDEPSLFDSVSEATSFVFVCAFVFESCSISEATLSVGEGDGANATGVAAGFA